MFGGHLDILFLVLSAVFGVLAWRERTRSDGRTSPAGRTWARIAVIFFVVAVFLAWKLRL